MPKFTFLTEADVARTVKRVCNVTIPTDAITITRHQIEMRARGQSFDSASLEALRKQLNTGAFWVSADNGALRLFAVRV